MAEGTTVVCPECGYPIKLGFVLTDVTFSGNQVNVGVNCPRCKEVWDAAPGDGTYTTAEDGQLRRVADVAKAVRDRLAHDPDAAARLRAALHQDADAGAAAVARELPEVEGFEEWAKAHPAMYALLLVVLSTLLAAMVERGLDVLDSEPLPAPPPAINVTVEDLSDDKIDRLVREALERQAAQPPDGEPQPPASNPAPPLARPEGQSGPQAR